MKTPTQHTPIPWQNINTYIMAEGLNRVARVNKYTDAEFIVRAVNAYEKMKTTLEKIAHQAQPDIQKGLLYCRLLAEETLEEVLKAEGR